ncbi:hypothetical protein M9H77_18912 [Catharanthus roseus]|uniref:Uncharacterized protein n=1 Tax=Catharanthus roseus TaxID=4058 RepID=A0ACC0B8V6_CATRO|nr:hypothetical protein M9H77_18912 [Catharanthus roseus]
MNRIDCEPLASRPVKTQFEIDVDRTRADSLSNRAKLELPQAWLVSLSSSPMAHRLSPLVANSSFSFLFKLHQTLKRRAVAAHNFGILPGIVINNFPPWAVLLVGNIHLSHVPKSMSWVIEMKPTMSFESKLEHWEE